MSYYIGVDGGGTKTAFALFDENKNIVAQNETEGSNHENLEGAIPQAKKRIEAILNRLKNGKFAVTADYCEALSLATVAYIILKEVDR